MATKKKKEEIVRPAKNILLEQVETKEIKKELENYIDEKINKVFVDELDKANKKLLRAKSRKILVKNIIIVLLLAIIGFLIYIMYSNNYFDKFFNKNNNEVVEKNEQKEEEKKEEQKEKTTVKEPTLDELKKEYASLLDNYVLSDKSNYLKDFYDGKLTDELKNYFTLNSLDFDSLKKEEDYQIILNDTFKLAYSKLFDGNYNTSNFDYNGNKIRYVSMMNSYMTTNLLEKNVSLIQRVIKDIKVNDSKVKITTIEGIVNNEKLYNIVNDKEVEDYKGDSLLNYSDSLNQVIYTFENNKLISLEK